MNAKETCACAGCSNRKIGFIDTLKPAIPKRESPVFDFWLGLNFCA